MTDLLKTLRVEDLAMIMHKSPKTLRDDVTRRPESLPPRLLIPGSRTVLWRECDVIEWLASRVKKPKRTRKNYEVAAEA